ncbi:vesicle-fusing ATPase [Monoraphidium neglectum]|uniref:Vesicle-fusing ATPase n=1 Tax=Monoraphidium neglectum TaxID=145388 RepID=A0A0D2L0J4_9CHLO|nr:vesicle-fusing ATPase [Monoraphidium neglectum]KIZ00939.1 vesicle-fusing ATPase [Monoraphidium neglectum]|eukprot:XP_013899958.1 vesicle-fusing ATPase [Monoraphidium neglectum]
MRASATTNYVYVSELDPLARSQFVEIGAFVFNVAGHPTVPHGSVALNSIQRRILKVSVRDAADVRAYAPPPSVPTANLLYGEIAYVTDKARVAQRELSANDIIDRLLKDFAGQVLSVNQQVVFELQGLNLRVVVGSLLVSDASGENRDVQRGFLRDSTAFIFTNSGQAPIKITGQKGFATNQLFKSRTLSFESLGIGGLDAQFESIFRRAFASRVFPPSILERLGIHHVKA